MINNIPWHKTVFLVKPRSHFETFILKSDWLIFELRISVLEKIDER